MAERQKYSLTNELRKADETLMGSPSLLGMTAMTWPNYINSMRSTMLTSHLKQFLNLLYPQSPFTFTNFENLVGKYSSGYKEAKHDLLVHRKIVKFDDILDVPRIYKVFVYDKVTKTYDVIERSVCANLTENFGYDYNNEFIDSLKEGDTVCEGDILYKSTSYDEDMNYGFGRNVVTAYTLDPFTSEDAAIASKSLSSMLTSIETETITIGLNNNDYLINLYGNKKNYKGLPDIGDKVSDIIGVVRRQFNNQLLFDFKDSSLREIHEGDIIYYVDKDVEVIDYTIYNNNENRDDSPFYNQINKYLDSQNRYYKEIRKTCKEIMNSGEKYSREIDYLYKRSGEMLDTGKKWRDGENTFGNMEIEISIHRKAPLARGCKITGRMGNKSVISEVWDDDKMPYTKDGRRVDLLLNLLAIVNRTTAFVLYELFINGCSYQIRQKMKELPTLKEKENLLFEYIATWNEEQCEKMHRDYKKLKIKEKELYMIDAIDNGIYIHQNPMWESTPIFYRCINIKKKFPFIKKDDLYINKWGREHKILNKYFIGEMYILEKF